MWKRHRDEHPYDRMIREYHRFERWEPWLFRLLLVLIGIVAAYAFAMFGWLLLMFYILVQRAS